MLDDMTEKARAQLGDEHVPWDEMREARNLKSTLAAWKEGSNVPVPVPVPVPAPVPASAPARVWIPFALAAGLAALAIGGVLLSGASSDAPQDSAVVAEAPADANPVAPADSPTPPVQTQSEDGSPLLAFADGSRAHLSNDASVVLAEESEDLLRLTQGKGEVRYEVTPDPDRRFVVDAAGVNVEVVGTVFVVMIAVDRVDVSVERGKVRVLDGEREITLEADERISVKRSTGDEVLPADADPPPAPKKRSAAELMDDYDTARAKGALAAAAENLEELIRAHPKDSRVPVALVSLGRLEAQRGNHVAAAKAFERYYARFSKQSLAEDALAEAAKAWKSASRTTKAQDAARRYLDRFPQGIHADAMRRMLD
jgi:transmembrane sensor